MDEIGLISSENITTRKINSTKSPYETLTIPKDKRTDYEDDGWEFVPSKLKKSIRVRKLKRHDVAFNDRVWALLAKMGFEYINSAGDFHLAYGSGLQKQIDVFAFDSEAILIVECKSTSKRHRVTYQKHIGEFASIKDDLRRSAQKLAPGKQKIAFLFCTNNAILSKPDRTRLSDKSIIHLNQDAIDYYEQLTDHLGPAAKYQLFGNLFAGQNIPGLENRFPAIKGKVPGGYTIYSFCIDPKYLLKIGYILHRSDTSADTTFAYQRIVKKNRLKQIATFIEKGGYFPNSIIINIDSKKRKDLKFDQASPIDHDGTTDFGILHLPRSYRSAFIIDGQHRLYGYSLERTGSNHTIPVVAFHNLPEEVQSKIFVDINHTQKSVPANLLQSIMAEFHWDSDNAKLALSSLQTRLLIELATDDDSPLYNRIIIAEEKKTDTKCLTIHTLKSWGLDRVNFLGQLRGKEKIKKGYLERKSNKETLYKAKDFLIECLKHFEAELVDQWNSGSGEGGFISMNIGISAIFRVIDDILEHIVTIKKIDPFSLSGDELAAEIIEYLVPITKFVKNLTVDSRKKLRGYFGSGATEKVQREFQNAIYEDNPTFCPDGLLKWREASTGQYNADAYEIGFVRIEPMIDSYIKSILKEAHGEINDNWWVNGVPIPIQQKCSDRKILNRSAEPPDHFLTTIEYETIISSKDNWPIFVEVFTPPGMENESKSKRTSWLKEFNSIRQKYTHPQRENVSEMELEFLKELDDWLTPRISGS